MSRKFTLLLLLIGAGGLGWTLYRKVIHPAETPSPAVSNKPSPAGAPVAAVQSGATPPAAATAPAAAPAADESITDVDSDKPEPPSSLIAMRLDDTRVYVALGSEGIDFEDQAQPLTKLGKGAKFGPGPVFQLNDELLKKYQELFKGFRVGEEWELHLSPDSRVSAVITAPVIVETGCFAAPGFVAQIAAADQLSFTSATVASKEYFLLSKPSAVPNVLTDPMAKPIGEVADWKATPEFALALEKVLNERMQQELSKIHEQFSKSGEYSRAAPLDPKGKPWPKIDDKLAHGEGKLDYETQAFQLTPDGVPRVYVRARWTIGGKSAFLMSAWVKADATASMEGADSWTARLMRTGEMQNEEVGLDKIAKVIDVFDLQHNHQAQFLMYSSGYEGMDITLYRYTAGPVRTRVSVGGGC